MMSKIQKICLWIFSAIFIIPEILWGSTIKIFRLNFLPIYRNVEIFNDNSLVAYLVIILEIIGVFGIIYFLNKNYKNRLKYFFIIIFILVLALLIFSLFLTYAVSHFNFF